MVKRFRLPIQSIELAESMPTNKVQLFRVGKFSHDEYGTFEITTNTLSEIKKNFDQKVRGIDLAIDYAHENQDVAAGWIRNLVLTDNGSELWAEVDWTPKGQKVLGEKEYRYLSPEFTFEYQDNETLKDFGPVLLGAGLTNRPVIKQMEPVIELQENEKSEEYMKELQEMKDKCTALMAENEKLAGQVKELSEKLGVQEKEKMLTERRVAFAKMLAEGKACAAQEDAFVKGDVAEFAAKAQAQNSQASGNSGGTQNGSQGEQKFEDPQDEVLHLAEKKLEAKQAKTKSEAISLVLKERQDLHKKIYV